MGTLKLVMLVDFSMILIVFHISFMCLFWRLARATAFAPVGLNIRKKPFIEFKTKSNSERDNQENRGESFRSSMHWDL